MLDAVVIRPGAAATGVIARDGRPIAFLLAQYRHDKPFLVLDAVLLVFETVLVRFNV